MPKQKKQKKQKSGLRSDFMKDISYGAGKVGGFFGFFAPFMLLLGIVLFIWGCTLLYNNRGVWDYGQFDVRGLETNKGMDGCKSVTHSSKSSTTTDWKCWLYVSYPEQTKTYPVVYESDTKFNESTITEQCTKECPKVQLYYKKEDSKVIQQNNPNVGGWVLFGIGLLLMIWNTGVIICMRYPTCKKWYGAYRMAMLLRPRSRW